MIKIPKNFDDCVRSGGKVKTKDLKNGKYIRICYDRNGNSFSSSVKTKKEESQTAPVSKAVKVEAEKQQIEVSKKLAEGLVELQKHFNTNYHV